MKRLFCVIPLVFLLCFAFGCQDKEAMAELEEFKAQAAVEEQNKGLFEGLLEELNKGNIAIWKELCASEFAYYYPSDISEPMSLEKTIETFQMVHKGFPDFNWNIYELIAKGDKVIARTIFAGTHEGEWQGIPPTGDKIKLSIISILQFKDGKCIEIREEEDTLGFMYQLGLELKPKEVKE